MTKRSINGTAVFFGLMAVVASATVAASSTAPVVTMGDDPVRDGDLINYDSLAGGGQPPMGPQGNQGLVDHPRETRSDLMPLPRPKPFEPINWEGTLEEPSRRWGRATIAALCAAGGAAVLFGVVCGLLKKESKKRLKQHARSKQKLQELRDKVGKLEAFIEALPLHDFRKAADEKIAEMRALLEADFVSKKQAVDASIMALHAESARLADELTKRRLHLEQVQLFVESMRDTDGTAFIENLTTVKTKVQKALERLVVDETALRGRLSQLVTLVTSLETQSTLHRAALDSLQAEAMAVKSRVVRADEETRAAKRTVERSVAEVDETRRAMGRAHDDCVRLLADLRSTVRTVDAMRTDAVLEKGSLDKKIKDITALLEKVRGQVGDVQRSAEHEAARLKNKHQATYCVVAPQPEPSAPF